MKRVKNKMWLPPAVFAERLALVNLYPIYLHDGLIHKGWGGWIRKEKSTNRGIQYDFLFLAKKIGDIIDRIGIIQM